MRVVGTRAGLAIAALLWIGVGAASTASAAPAFEPPPGWTMRVHEGGLLLQPGDLPAQQLMQVYAGSTAVTRQAAGLDAYAAIRPDVLRGLGAVGLPTCKPPQLLAQGVVLQDCIAAVNGASVTMQVFMRPPHDGEAEWMRIAFSRDEALVARHSAAMQGLARNPALWPALKQAVRDDKTQRADAERAAQLARNAAEERAMRTPPGQGIKDSDIAALLWVRRQPSGASLVEELHLLLKDGTGFRSLDVPPDEFNVAAARKLRPKRWFQWRRSGDGYQFKGPEDRDWTAQNGSPALPGPPGERLSRSFTHSWYVMDLGFGGATAQYSFHFKPDGRFEQSGKRTFGTGAMQAGNGVAGTATTTYNKDGTTSTSSVSSTAAVGGAARQQKDGSEFSGRYRIDGWAIVFERDNGETERALFAFSGAQRGSVFIHDRGYFGAQSK